jgi:hypothetical protein
MALVIEEYFSEGIITHIIVHNVHVHVLDY